MTVGCHNKTPALINHVCQDSVKYSDKTLNTPKTFLMWKAKENISIVFILHITVLKAVPCETIDE